MNNYIGEIIEESLSDTKVLKRLHIVSTRVEKVTPAHNTPHLTQWTLDTIEVLEGEASRVAQELSHCLDTTQGNWYIDFRNDTHHYVIYRDKVFCIDRTRREQYEEAKKYGLSLGIPEYQVDFGPDVVLWQR